jgi:hypothetical protein
LIGGMIVITGVAVIVMLGQSKTTDQMGAED